MPNHTYLGDPKPYRLHQTDFIIQLGSDVEDVNRWVYQHISAKEEETNQAINARPCSRMRQRTYQDTAENDIDIRSTIENWAVVTDIHTGFQRIDGRNLMGFNDGISNPKRLANDTVWTTFEDESEKYIDRYIYGFSKN